MWSFNEGARTDKKTEGGASIIMAPAPGSVLLKLYLLEQVSLYVVVVVLNLQWTTLVRDPHRCDVTLQGSRNELFVVVVVVIVDSI